MKKKPLKTCVYGFLTVSSSKTGFIKTLSHMVDPWFKKLPDVLEDIMIRAIAIVITTLLLTTSCSTLQIEKETCASAPSFQEEKNAKEPNANTWGRRGGYSVPSAQEWKERGSFSLPPLLEAVDAISTRPIVERKDATGLTVAILDVNSDCSIAAIFDWRALLGTPWKTVAVKVPDWCQTQCNPNAAYIVLQKVYYDEGILEAKPDASCIWSID